MRVLVVDDDLDLALMLARILTKLGHDAEACADTTEAIEQHAFRRFDVVIADYLMHPDDGIAVLSAFEHTDAYRILLTASYATVEMNDAVKAGVIHTIVAKPASLSDLRYVLSLAMADSH